jgi:hypothetical protein
MEWWSDGVMGKREHKTGRMLDKNKRNFISKGCSQYSNTPISHHSSLPLLQYSNTPGLEERIL